MDTSMVDSNETRRQIERARGGDRAAFDELMAGHFEALRVSIRRRMGTTLRERIEPEDLVQETLIRAFGSLESFEWQGEGSFRRWLESIATHVAVDAARYHGRRRVLQIDRDLEGSAPSPSKVIRRRERFERLNKAMESLSPDYHAVLNFSRIEGLSVKEIATRLGRSESAVKNLLLRATRKLREAFGDTESLNLGDGHFKNSEETNEW